jgi:hypothetical protein
MARYQDITGLIFGKLTAKSYAGRNEKGGAMWLCACECGGEKTANATELKRGNTQSCGCLALEQKRAAGKTRQHAYSRVNMYRERKSWESMIARCHVPTHQDFANYGGRGITVCDRWRNSFEAFVQDMGMRPENTTLDRRDNAIGYNRDNCRWADKTTQANNRRDNRRITIDGVTQTVAQWARIKGVRDSLIHARLYQGWSEHDAVMTAVGASRS